MVSMPSIASDGADEHVYGFSFAWRSPYGHAVRLLEKLAPTSGLIVDIGAGSGAIAQPLLDLGYEYVGVDIDDGALASLARQGLECHRLDLGETGQLATKLHDIVAGREVSAVLMLDVVEHMPRTRSFLTSVRDALETLRQPPLLVSVPNVAHVDIASKLVFGRWDYTTTGLLDATHLQLFTAERLERDFRACGLLEVDKHDFQLWQSDQHFPAEHPGLASKSPVAQLLTGWRELADSHAHTVQFVRAFTVGRTVDSDPVEPPPQEAHFATVVVRTQCTRLAHLCEALTCLAAQTMTAFDVLIMIHADDAEYRLSAITDLVAEFDPSFSTRVEVVPVSGGGRARPLNAALEQARGEYVVFLDDDDLVTADWIETFHEGAHDGAIVRSIGAVRRISPPASEGRAPYSVCTGLEFPYQPAFDFLFHLWGNETPICTFAVPRQLIDLGIRFDERLAVLEDWDFLLRCVALAPVQDTGKVTSIYQMWRSGESSASEHHADVWLATQRLVQEKQNERAILFPAGVASDLIRAVQSEREMPSVKEELERARGELTRLRSEYLMTIGSRRWRALAGPARLVGIMRRLVGRKR